MLNIVITSLKDIKKAINGEILLSEQLDECLNSLYLGMVPSMWKKVSYPSLKPLGGYVLDLKQRLETF